MEISGRGANERGVGRKARESARERASEPETLLGNRVHNGGSWARSGDRRCITLVKMFVGKSAVYSRARQCQGFAVTRARVLDLG